MHEIEYCSEGILPGRIVAPFIPKQGEILFLGDEGYDVLQVCYRQNHAGTWQAHLTLGPEPVR